MELYSKVLLLYSRNNLLCNTDSLILSSSAEATQTIKGLVHPKMKISLCFTHPQSILGVYDFLLSDESNQSYIKNCPGPSKPYNGVSGCFLSTVQKT